MTAFVRLRVLGSSVNVQFTGPESAAESLAAGVRRRWHLCLRDDDDAPDRLIEAVLRPPDETRRPRHWDRADTVVEDSDERRLLQRLTQSITHAIIEHQTGQLLMLHAAALTHQETGATAVFVAPGNTGKTTLSHRLGQGRGYVTDETVGIRRDGGIEIYPKPLSVRRADWAGVKDETAPGDLGLVPPAVDPWVAGIVLLSRDLEHVGEPLVEELELFDAVLGLSPESSGFMGTEAPLQWVADILGRTGGAKRVTYAEVTDLEPLLDSILERTSTW